MNGAGGFGYTIGRATARAAPFQAISLLQPCGSESTDLPTVIKLFGGVFVNGQHEKRAFNGTEVKKALT